jgi:hypothetical protein
VTVPEFEVAALAAIARIPGANREVAEVTADIVHVGCHIDGQAYELSYSYDAGDDASRERAFAAVLRGVENTRRRYHGEPD